MFSHQIRQEFGMVILMRALKGGRRLPVQGTQDNLSSGCMRKQKPNDPPKLSYPYQSKESQLKCCCAGLVKPPLSPECKDSASWMILASNQDGAICSSAQLITLGLHTAPGCYLIKGQTASCFQEARVTLVRSGLPTDCAYPK